MKKRVVISIIICAILTVVISGIMSSSAGETYIQPETLTVTKNTAECYCGPQDMSYFGTFWQGNAQMLWQTMAADVTLDLQLNVDKAGKYSVGIVFTKGPDFATVDVLIDGKNCASDIDTYSAVIEVGSIVDLGVLDLSAGAHTFTIYNKGKNDRSAGYIVGVDYIRLEESTGATPSPAPTYPSDKYLNAIDNADIAKREGVDFTVDKVGTYFITAGLEKSSSDRNTVLSLDGNTVISAVIPGISKYAQLDTVYVCGIGNMSLTAGSHSISASDGAVIKYIDVVALKGLERWEAESLYIEENTAPDKFLGVQDMTGFGELWSGNGHFLWQVSEASNSLTQEIEIDKDGLYILGGVFTVAPDFACLDVYVDDVLCFKELNCYGAGV